MNLLKLLTRSGRQSLAIDLMSEYFTTEKVSRYAAQGVNSLLGKVRDKTLLESVAVKVTNVSDLTGKIADAVRDGEVTESEADTITLSAQACTGSIFTQETLDALIRKVASYVP